MTSEQLEAIRQYDTCKVANAIETFHVRQRNEGFTRPGLQWMVPGTPPMLGFACTSRMKTVESPPVDRGYLDRTDWWRDLPARSLPRIAVIEDADERPGLGSVVGEVHSAIFQALGCLGVVTNGSVRDLQALERIGFAAYAGGVSPSHSYAHLLSHGGEVTIQGLRVRPGDLLLVDRHGMVSIPLEIAPLLPEAIERQRAKERRIVEFCRSPEFSIERLEELVR